jgi:hypothetical protein
MCSAKGSIDFVWGHTDTYTRVGWLLPPPSNHSYPSQRLWPRRTDCGTWAESFIIRILAWGRWMVGSRPWSMDYRPLFTASIINYRTETNAAWQCICIYIYIFVWTLWTFIYYDIYTKYTRIYIIHGMFAITGRTRYLSIALFYFNHNTIVVYRYTKEEYFLNNFLKMCDIDFYFIFIYLLNRAHVYYAYIF